MRIFMETQADETDIQTRVLQNTLAEVISSRSSRTDDDNKGEGDPAAADADADADADAVERCCVICLDNVSEICEAQPCQHRDFDYLCLLNWLQQQPRCPLCKSDVREVRYDFQQADSSENAGSNGDTANGYKVYIVPPVQERQQQGSSSQLHRGGIAHPLNRVHALHYRRRRFEPRPSSPRPVTEDEALVRRRRVYQAQLYSLHVGSSPRTGYRDLTPEAFERDAELVSRARRWLRRELQVFEFLRPDTTTSTTTAGSTAPAPAPAPAAQGGDRLARRRANNAEFLLEYVVAILKTVDVQGSQGQAEEMLKDFLGRENARLLLHELRSFLRSPYSLETWDRKVQYPNPKRRRPSSADENEDQLRGHGREFHRAGGSGSGSSARWRGRLDNDSTTEAERPPSRGVADSYRPSYSRKYDRRRRTERQYTPD